MTPHTPEGTVGKLTREQITKIASDVVQEHGIRLVDSLKLAGQQQDGGGYDGWNLVALCEIAIKRALRPDSSGEAVREACAKVAENNRSWEQAGMFIARDILNLAFPTLPAAEGWVSVEAKLLYRVCGHLYFLSGEAHAKPFLAAMLDSGWLERVRKDAKELDAALPAPPAAGDV